MDRNSDISNGLGIWNTDRFKIRLQVGFGYQKKSLEISSTADSNSWIAL